ncbi:hypothetical protein JWS13_02125 (plasmid) [Rhodococcus pseudokoreensis]|uniref:Uncharacterized protein n=1 Tax=Rhodococcus pseudokoreensis TaxID=2811421 RepID=A0A974ZRF4_9NOCA|nr:hypothetical protein [Rhodococcus pseudokoreensis]QSE87441.1 hypothetical protein JWS13_02125 [Rhodococcus pseudokoreensis]
MIRNHAQLSPTPPYRQVGTATARQVAQLDGITAVVEAAYVRGLLRSDEYRPSMG